MVSLKFTLHIEYMTHNSLMQSLFAFFCILSIFNVSQVLALSKRNVLFIVVDDLRPVFHAVGDKHAVTPNIDKLIGNSIYFTNAYAQQALCAPSRNSLLTSRRPDSLHLYDFYSYWRHDIGNFTTLPQYFKENGYFTYSIGKIFHPGISSNCSDDYPISWSLPAYHPITEKYLNAPICIDHVTGHKVNNLLCPVALDLVPHKTLPDIESTHHVKKLLRNAYASSSPFFIALGYHKPHIPFTFPYQYLKYYNDREFDKPDDNFKPHDLPAVAWNPFIDLRKRHDVTELNVSFPFGTLPKEFAMKTRHHYYASVTYIDDLIGEVLKEVDFTNTVVVLTADHGWSLGEHAEWAKYSNLDVALKVPLVIHDSSLPITNKQIHEPVELLDIFPTLVDVMGLPRLEMCDRRNAITCTEGKSLYDLMNTNGVKSEYSAFSQYPRPGMYPTLNPSSDEPKLKQIKIMGYTIKNQFRYTVWLPFDKITFRADWNHVLEEELYDHTIDEGEYLNLARRGEMQQIKNILFDQLKAKYLQLYLIS